MTGQPHELTVERWAAIIDWTRRWEQSAADALTEAEYHAGKAYADAYADGYTFDELQAATQCDMSSRP